MLAHLHLAPSRLRLASTKLSDYPGFQAGYCRRRILGRSSDHVVAAGDNERSAPGQGGLMHPSFDTVRIPNEPPNLKLALDLDRQVASLINPLDRIPRTWSGAQIYIIGAQRSEARQR